MLGNFGPTVFLSVALYVGGAQFPGLVSSYAPQQLTVGKRPDGTAPRVAWGFASRTFVRQPAAPHCRHTCGFPAHTLACSLMAQPILFERFHRERWHRSRSPLALYLLGALIRRPRLVYQSSIAGGEGAIRNSLSGTAPSHPLRRRLSHAVVPANVASREQEAL